MHFSFSEASEFSGSDVEGEGSKLGALDFFNEETDLLKHAADLAVAALDQNHFVPWIGSVFDEANFCGRGFDAAAASEGNGDSGPQALNGLLAWLSADFDEIGFPDVRAGLGELLRKCAVVGHEKQALAGIVEAAHRIDALGVFRKQVHDSGAAFRIAHSSDETLGLVEEEVDEGLGAFQGLAVHANDVALRVGLGP